MLDFMRRAVKSWVAKGLILLLIASFAVWGIGDVFSFRLDSAAARVGDAKVSASAFADAMARQRSQLSQSQGRAISYAEMRAAGIDRLILGRLIRDAAFAEELAALGISAPDDAVAEAIRTNPAFQGPGGAFSQSNYRLSLGRLGFSPSEFEALTRTLLGQQVLEDAAGGLPPVPPGLATRIAAWQGERRAVATVTLPLSAAPDPGTPTEAQLEAHYTAHEADYVEPERRSGQYLFVDVAALAAAAQPDEAAVAAYYEQHREQWSRPEARVIDQLSLTVGQEAEQVARARATDTGFEDLARELGEDPAQLSLGRVEREDLPEATAEAVFAATEPGLVGPVEAPFGPVLIRIREVETGGSAPLEAVRAEIVAHLAEEAALQEAPRLANLIEDRRAGGATMEEIGAEPGIAHGRFDRLARDGSLPGGARAEGLPARDQFREEAFAALDHEERELVQTPAGGYFVLVVERVEESALNPLDKVRERVAADWAAAQRLSGLGADAGRLARELTAADGLAALAQARGLTLTAHDPFPRERAPDALPPGLVARLFEAEAGQVLVADAPDGGGVILAGLTEVRPLEGEALGRLSGRVERELARLMSEDDRELFARAVTASYPVSVDDTAVEEVFNLLGAARSGG